MVAKMLRLEEVVHDGEIERRLGVVGRSVLANKEGDGVNRQEGASLPRRDDRPPSEGLAVAKEVW
jgi:hypothetical protein